MIMQTAGLYNSEESTAKKILDTITGKNQSRTIKKVEQFATFSLLFVT